MTESSRRANATMTQTGSYRRLVAAVVVALVLSLPAAGSTESGGCAGLDIAIKPFAFEAVTVGGASKELTAAVYAVAGQPAAAAALISTETAAMRFRVDGVAAPTASVGHYLPAGSTRLICGIEAIQQFRGIRTTSTSVDLSASYFRPRR